MLNGLDLIRSDLTVYIPLVRQREAPEYSLLSNIILYALSVHLRGASKSSRRGIPLPRLHLVSTGQSPEPLSFEVKTWLVFQERGIVMSIEDRDETYSYFSYMHRVAAHDRFGHKYSMFSDTWCTKKSPKHGGFIVTADHAFVYGYK